jgi:hypothetical protein
MPLQCEREERARVQREREAREMAAQEELQRLQDFALQAEIAEEAKTLMPPRSELEIAQAAAAGILEILGVDEDVGPGAPPVRVSQPAAGDDGSVGAAAHHVGGATGLFDVDVEDKTLEPRVVLPIVADEEDEVEAIVTGEEDEVEAVREDAAAEEEEEEEEEERELVAAGVLGGQNEQQAFGESVDSEDRERDVRQEVQSASEVGEEVQSPTLVGNEAATRIQALARGRRDRQRVGGERALRAQRKAEALAASEAEAATTIQAVARGRRERRRRNEEAARRRREEEEAAAAEDAALAVSQAESATMIQALARGRRDRAVLRARRQERELAARRLEAAEEERRAAGEEVEAIEDETEGELSPREEETTEDESLDGEGETVGEQGPMQIDDDLESSADALRSELTELSDGADELADDAAAVASGDAEEQDDEGADVEEEYSKEMAATKIQAVARGRRDRRRVGQDGEVRVQAKRRQEEPAAEGRAEVEEAAGAEADLKLTAADAREAGEERTALGASPSPAAEVVDEAGVTSGAAEQERGGENEPEQELTPAQERRRRIEARMRPISGLAEGGPASPEGALAAASPAAAAAAGKTASVPEGDDTAAPAEKRERKKLRPLPAITAPHNDPAVAEKLMAERLGDPPDVWRIEWKDLKLSKSVGVGNFAEVYSGHYKREHCAIKRFTHQSMSSQGFMAFANETAFLHRLRHPHVIQLFGACVEPGNLCIVTEFVPKGNLHNVLTKRKIGEAPTKIEWRTRVQMGIDLAAAVAFLHQQSPPVLHLDIKSPNLLVDKDMRLKLADFGLAREKSHEDAAGVDKETFQPGTVHWMAPELMTKGIKTEKTDVYAIGVVLWELWIMKTPYAGLKVNEIATKVRTGTRPSLPETALPSPAENAVYHCLMEECWHEDKDVRPHATAVHQRLSEHLGVLVSAEAAGL